MKPIRPIHDPKLNNYPDTLDQMHKILNGGFVLGGFASDNATNSPGNADCVHASVVSPGVANTEFAVTHNLNRIPTMALPGQNSNGGVVYNSGTPWTKSQIFLKCSSISCGLNLLIY